LVISDLGQLNAKGVDAGNVKDVYLLKSGAELPFKTTWWGNSEPGNFFITVSSVTEKPVKYDTVVKIYLKE